MRNQRALNFGRAEPPTVDLKYVIGAPAMPKVAVLILVALVSRTEPGTLKGFFGFLGLVPITRTNGVSLDH